ncbi:MAG: hypothetical protein A2X49_15055 [Lentisphaerae bacterium GWF2_52_8]|nr:MAG: hypothetical protein A2X49_15055 [Lentisphaerae bacterium GWF2_52_8]
MRFPKIFAAALCTMFFLSACSLFKSEPEKQNPPVSAAPQTKPDNTPVNLATAGVQKPLAAEPKNNPAISPALPFAVMLAGKSAVPHNDSYGIIADPVPANAELSIDIKSDLVIINAFPSDENGKELSVKPIIILINKGSKSSLDKALDHKKFTPGTYIMSINANDKTSRVLFSVN